jgi:hypothetical protein
MGDGTSGMYYYEYGRKIRKYIPPTKQHTKGKCLMGNNSREIDTELKCTYKETTI